MTQKAISPVISIYDGDVDIFTDVQGAAAYFCYADAMSDELELLGSTGQFLRAYESGRHAVSFELDPSRPPAPDYLADQLRLWVRRTRDRVDYGGLDPDTAPLPELVESVLTARRIGPEPTLMSEVRRLFRRKRS